MAYQGVSAMAHRGVGYFDSKGQFFRSPQEATQSDLAGLLGRMGDGDSLAPGIAKILLDKRREIEHIFRDHDDMIQGGPIEASEAPRTERHGSDEGSNVTPINPARSG
jgi:hypothetical protein